MNVLILGAGAREHALALGLVRSPSLTRLFIAPGNPGASRVAQVVGVDIDDHAAVVRSCETHAIDLVVIGSEGPLVAGIVDDLSAAGILCFGPTRAAARLEGSKGFTKDFCREFAIPTAAYERFDRMDEALAFVREKGAPIVVKADGLAAGKGVVVATTLTEAEDAVRSMFGGDFGAAGASVVIEQVLEGEEVSFFAISDGVRAEPFSCAQDHKRVGDGDTGPNTGGMGAYSPAPVVTKEMCDRIMRDIIAPTIDGMRARRTPFQGVLFAGLMIGADGPKLIEFNVRFGDPEAEVVLARLESDLLELLLGSAQGRLPPGAPQFSDETALTVVLAARGYPGAIVKGSEVRGVEEASRLPGVTIHYAGVSRQGSRLLATGGRVFAVTAKGDSVAQARERAYAAVDAIDWPEGFCRRDIGWRAIAHERGD